MTSIKGIYSKEANEELEKQLNSKSHFIALGAENAMTVGNEGVQVIYDLTRILDDSKINNPTFKKPPLGKL